MVCKTCGAYNAENLTNCKVCGAKLKSTERNDDIPARQVDALIDEDTKQENAAAETRQPADGRPEKRFAAAPVWPTKAFNASERPDYSGYAPRDAEPAKESNASWNVQDEIASEPAAKEETAFCASCGKPLIPGAMFCPYCGTKVASAAPVKAPEKPLEQAATAAAFGTAARKHTSSRDSFEEESFADEFSAPRKRRAAEKEPEPVLPDADENFDDLDDSFEDHKKSKSWFKSRKSKLDLDEDIEELDDYEADDSSDDDDEEYDDEYYDQEFDDEETEKKRKGSTILFVVLIAILLALILFFATYLLKKNGGSLLGLFNKKQPATVSDVVEQNPDEQTQSASKSGEIGATIEETESNGVPMFTINVHAPTGSTVRLITKATLENDTVPISQDDQVSIRVPREVFLPGDYCESTTVTVTPQLEVTTPDGTKQVIDVPSATVTVPQVSLVLEQPETNPVEAHADGSAIEVKGTVTDHTVEVTINGEKVQVYEGGVFSGSYTPMSGQDDSIVVVAKKVNCVTATETIEVTPYVVKDMEIVVTSEGANLTASDNRVLVEGTCPSGAELTASCESGTVTCGDVLVADGRFSCPINFSGEGCFTITFSGKAEGYNDGTASCVVENYPTVKSSTYKSKALDVAKNYQKLVEGKATDTALTFSGTIKEIAADSPYVIFRMEDSHGNSVYVCNRSARNTINNADIGKKKIVAGYNAGLYEDSGCPFIWGWFIWNK